MTPPDAVAAVPSALPPDAGSGVPPLRRLPGRAPASTRLFANHHLWLARDFLLHAKSLPYSQEIQQFAYRDIQALELCGSSRGLVYNLVLGFPLVVLALLAIFESNRDTRVGWLIAVVCFLVPLIVNVARGPTCLCLLQTALGPQALPSLSRRRPARRALALIAERVDAAQAKAEG